jgi:hypothetical protein
MKTWAWILLVAAATFIAAPALAVQVPPWDHGCGPDDYAEKLAEKTRREEQRWLRMTGEERIADEMRRARLERERAKEQAMWDEYHRRRAWQGREPGTWLYWFSNGGL